MNNKTVAENWRDQTGKAKNGSSMYYEGKTIYSYGYHFPMAYITDSTFQGKDIILQNSNGYSNSTAKHLNHMRGQCYDDAVITISTELLKKFIDAMKYSDYDKLPALKKEAKAEIEARKADQELKLSRARAEHRKESYKRDIAENNLQLEILEVV